MQSNTKNKIKPKNKTRSFTIVNETYRLACGELKSIPFIRLRGKWLTDAGFSVGQKIKVSIFKNRLVIIPNTHNLQK